MEKRKNEVVIAESDSPRSNGRAAAFVLIGIGLVFLLVNMGVFDMNSIGEFFGNFGRSMGEFFGNFGETMGRFGESMGEFFGNLGGSLAQFWPVILIAFGVVLLLRRQPQR
ncbi:MAG: hypothetical protein JNM70_23895 [Anaerolineae bacterium]|nr:hypothetical protein [Anaerolineae bacterium]